MSNCGCREDCRGTTAQMARCCADRQLIVWASYLLTRLRVYTLAVGLNFGFMEFLYRQVGLRLTVFIFYNSVKWLAAAVT